MSRISLVEAYDNRDVIGQLVKLRQDVKELYDIVENINPSGDLTNFVTKTGDETIDGIKTFIGKIVADCDIIQNGASYETHAEQVFSKDDYIIMRDGAVAGLAVGDHSGLQVKLYNGVDDARLAVDRDGVARVGDVGDEQPLLTRDETADMTSGNILSWDGVNLKAITSGKSVSDLSADISTVQGNVNTLSGTVAGKVSGTGNIGSDTKPVKIVNGVAVAVAENVLTVDGGTLKKNKQLIFSIDPYNAPFDIHTSSGDGNNIQLINVFDSSNNSLMGLYLTYDSTNGVRLNASLRNANGTYRYVPIA